MPLGDFQCFSSDRRSFLKEALHFYEFDWLKAMVSLRFGYIKRGFAFAPNVDIALGRFARGQNSSNSSIEPMNSMAFSPQVPADHQLEVPSRHVCFPITRQLFNRFQRLRKIWLFNLESK